MFGSSDCTESGTSKGKVHMKSAGRLTLGRGRASARQPSRLLHRQRDGVTAVAVRDSVLRTSSAATAAPLRLRHVGPGRAAYTKDVVQTRLDTRPGACNLRYDARHPFVARRPSPSRAANYFGSEAAAVWSRPPPLVHAVHVLRASREAE